MKNILLLLAITLLFACGEKNRKRANNDLNATERTERQMEMLQERLSLTDEQTLQMDALLDKYRSKTSDLRNSLAENKEELRDSLRNLAEKRKIELSEILNEEQMKLLEEFESMREGMRKRRQPTNE